MEAKPIDRDFISELSDSLLSEMANLSTTISSLSLDSSDVSFVQIGFAVLLVLIGAFSAYIFNLLHWQMVLHDRRLATTKDSLISLVSELEKEAINYWLQDYCDDSDCLRTQQMSEVSIKSRIRLINKYRILLIEQAQRRLKDQARLQICTLNDDIFELITGDEFEGVSRRSSKSKAMKIATTCSDFRATLFAV